MTLDTHVYEAFLKSKVTRISEIGFEVTPEQVNDLLFPWQNEIVRWACRLGKAALFEECGAGKTLQQLEWARLVCEYTGGKVLILAPLAVAHQTVAEGRKIMVSVKYCRSQAQADAADERIIITNYDMVKEFDPDCFSGVVLDESSILKSFTGSTKRMLLEMFDHTSYKLACTATPAPNDYLELGNHAQFLNIMDSNEMIARWFINDTMQAGGYRLKHHARHDFWRWVTSWAVCVSKPSDLGYSDDGFDLPNLNIKSHVVEVDHTRAFESGQLFVLESLSATGMWKEKRETAADRCQTARDIVGESPDPWIIWCDTNSEADLLMDLFHDTNYVEVRGNHSMAVKEERLSAFSSGEAQIIITKPDIAGFGLNWQHCPNQVFVGVTYSFEKFYQALRRSWRFGQKKEVHAHLIYAETEGDIYKVLQEKQEAFKEMQSQMNEAMREHGLGARSNKLELVEVEKQVETGGKWEMRLGDSIKLIADVPDNSIDLSVYSPPFSNLYIYSDALADMGNSADDEEFFTHYLFLIKELFRVTFPGRLSAVHCKDLPMYANRDGAAGLKDFPGMIIRAHEEAGWVYHSRVTIWKDPVIEMQRTKNHGLLYKNLRERGEVSRQGMADYMLVFRKWEGVEGTTSPKPVIHDPKDFPLEQWQQWASPVWMDIRQTNVLNYRIARGQSDEKHICPLQLDVIERSVGLWSNPDDLVFSPFAGIGSEGYQAVKMGRRFLGFELKPNYFDQAVKHLKLAEEQAGTKTLFDM